MPFSLHITAFDTSVRADDAAALARWPSADDAPLKVPAQAASLHATDTNTRLQQRFHLFLIELHWLPLDRRH